jgi:hypothetical protein
MAHLTAAAPEGYKHLVRFCDVDEPATMGGKLYHHDVASLQTAATEADSNFDVAHLNWLKNRKNSQTIAARNSARKAQLEAATKLRTVTQKQQAAEVPEKREALAVRHANGALGRYSPFVSLSENPGSLVNSTNKVAQGIIRDPRNYVPDAVHFPEFPATPPGYRRAPHVALFSIPQGQLFTPEDLRSAVSPETNIDPMLEAGEHLISGPEGVRPYLVGHVPNPF